MDVKHHETKKLCAFLRAQKLCESRGGRPELLTSNSPYGLCGRKATFEEEEEEEDCVSELRSCVEVEVDVLGSPYLTVSTVSVAEVQCCFTSTKTIRTVRHGEPRTATSSFTQLLISVDVKQH